ncbi:MAG TPA: PAS domain-containing sensor histidine kinase [Candidatus Saccharimonadales bacterium]|nr:PAS domain-containing sensor histidine kinase [Candidatus Saccharimonadales bacterium]
MTTAKTPLSNLESKHSATLVELDKYKLLVEAVEDYAIFMLDDKGYVQTWNKGARKNKGYKAEEIIGKHFSTFYRLEDKKAKKPERELKLATQLGRVEDEDWRVRKDGSQFWANVVITALRDEKGKLVGFAKVTRDLTERKKNEDILRYNNALLLKQRRDLQALNISKDEFISLASHQLRTPATAIKQLLGMITQGFTSKVDPSILSIVTRAYEANERLIRIVDNLLRVALLDAGKVVLRKKPINLSEYLADIAAEHAGSILKRSQTIELKISKSAPKLINADPDHLRMAIGNLIDNASKYSYEDSKIVLKASADKKDCVVAVQDNGVGVKQDEQKELFEKFSRVQNELSDKVGGSGLGLYWVKHVIEMHGGTIGVSSNKGAGSTFTLRLPLKEIHA